MSPAAVKQQKQQQQQRLKLSQLVEPDGVGRFRGESFFRNDPSKLALSRGRPLDERERKQTVLEEKWEKGERGGGDKFSLVEQVAGRQERVAVVVRLGEDTGKRFISVSERMTARPNSRQ